MKGEIQLDFDGLTVFDKAIMRLKEFEPPEGYYLAFSGGKDSIVIYDLAVKAGVKFDAHYNMPGIDPPELVRFIREYYPSVTKHKPIVSIWKSVYNDTSHGMPTRLMRWCCQVLKETSGERRTVVTGIRWAESARRKQRRMFEICRTDGTKHYLHPIIDFTNNNVWSYIRENNLPYCSLYDEGFKRLGCVLCPMATPKETKQQIERWPKIAAGWERAAKLYWETTHHPGPRKYFKSADDYWAWWLTRKGMGSNTSQCTMFD